MTGVRLKSSLEVDRAPTVPATGCSSVATGSASIMASMANIPATSLRFQRLAELVADRLRERILRGDLQDGDLLSKEEDLRAEYPVSKPSIREAMRILEAEGLITVRRGNVGGAIVHRPTSSNVGYTLSLVLSANQVPIHDVATALRAVEPTCAVLCAGRRDRRRVVVPRLRTLHKQALASIDDLVQATALSRRFHETMVELCGNETLIIMVGALEKLWSSHETRWASAAGAATVPVDERRAALQTHGEIIDLIAAGEASEVHDLAAVHLSAVQSYPSSAKAGVVDPLIMRDHLP